MDKSTENDFGEWLRKQYHQWTGKELGKTGRIRSQNEFCGWIGVPPTSMSMWMNNVRKPTGGAVDKLADKLGPEVYDRLGLPRRMPRNRFLLGIANDWSQLDEQQQREIYERVKNLTKRKEGNGNHSDI